MSVQEIGRTSALLLARSPTDIAVRASRVSSDWNQLPESHQQRIFLSQLILVQPAQIILSTSELRHLFFNLLICHSFV